MKSNEIFGTEIQYYRLEPRYWGRVLDRMVEAGLKCATTYVCWGTHMVGPPDAQNPAGELDFEGRTDPRLNLLKFMDMVQERGLFLNFRCGPFCCAEMNYGGYPKFLVMDDPDMMVWNHADKPTQGYWIARKEGMQPSYLHPVYLDWCRKWLNEVDACIRPRLRTNGGCIDMINLDNEVSYITKDGFLDSDYNPVNVQPGGFWHQFLTEKYGAATRLPYGKSYAMIDQVPPPRQVPEDMSGDVAWHLDWVEFKEWAMCKYLVALREMHEANGVDDVIFMTNFNPHLPEGVPTRMPSFERAVRGKRKGITGYDFYRGTFLSWSGYSSMARVLKLMNASVDYTWSAEFMAGTWNKDLSQRGRVSDDHMRFMARCALAQGCKSIAWYMFHDRVVWGDAPVSSHGHARPSLEVLRETRALCVEKIPHWDALEPQGDCAIIYDVAAHRHTSVGDPSPCSDGTLHVGAPLVDGVQAGESSREYTGLFRVVEAGGAQANAVDILERPDALDAYRLAFLPGGALLSKAAAGKLQAWMENGGHLVVGGAWPTRDESGAEALFVADKDPGPGAHPVGAGRLIRCDALGTEEPEAESVDAIARVQAWLREYAGPPAVSIAPVHPVEWQDWVPGGGVDNAGTKGGEALDRVRTFNQPRTLASAVLHEGGDGFPVLFVLNHYPDAFEFELTFGKRKPKALRCLDHDEVVQVRDQRVRVDLDRKSCAVFAVEM